MSTVIAEHVSTWWAWLATYGAVALICFTRLYAAAYLPHQMVLSWAWGSGGFYLVQHAVGVGVVMPMPL